MMMWFHDRHCSSYADLIAAVEHYQHRFQLGPVLHKLIRLVERYKQEFARLQQTFLSRPPVPVHAPPEFPFSIQSSKKQIRAAARRFALGVQSRGVHVSLRQASSMLQHVDFALQSKHPALLVKDVLEPPWYAFSQCEFALRTFGPQSTWKRVLVHRQVMLTWPRSSNSQFPREFRNFHPFKLPNSRPNSQFPKARSRLHKLRRASPSARR